MAIQMKALRRMYLSRTEYIPGQTFSVPDSNAAERLERRSKAERLKENSAAAPGGDDIAALRNQYREVIGRGPFMGWDAATLKQKMAEYQTTNMGHSALTTHLTARK